MRKQSHGQTKQLPSMQQKQLYPKPSVHQRAAFFCSPSMGELLQVKVLSIPYVVGSV